MELTQSESQLSAFLEKVSQQYTTMLLRPQEGATIIRKEPVNLCVVSVFGSEFTFDGISEGVFDSLVENYDWREDSVRQRKKLVK